MSTRSVTVGSGQQHRARAETPPTPHRFSVEGHYAIARTGIPTEDDRVDELLGSPRRES